MRHIYYSSLLAFIFAFFITNQSQALSYYTYQSGNWSNANVWTTDPSGTTLVSPAVPGNGDAVTILNGITVTLTANVATTTHVLTINSGGILNLSTFSFTSGLTSINGTGTLRVATSYFPSGTNNFTTSTGSSVEYYDWSANATLPTTVTTYYNLTLSHSLASTRTIAFGSGATTVNGDFVLSCTGTGLVFQLGDVTGVARSLIFNDDVSIGTNCTMNVLASTTVTHSVTCAGNFTVDGTLDLQNNADYSATTTNVANITFNGSADKTLTINSSATSFGGFTLNKGSDQTFILSVVCTVAGTSPFDGNISNNMIVLTNGTLKLGSNLTVPQLNTTGNYDVSTSQNNNAGIWIDGATVSQGGGSAMVVYGKFRISAGSYVINSGQACIVTRDQGELLFEGGTTTMVTLRPSVNALSTGSYTQTGGTVNITGAVTNTSFPVFCWPFTTASFNMSGGTINVALPTASGTAVNGGILIASSAYSVTGGTWNVTVPASAINFNINSTVPFWDMNVTKAGAGTGALTIGSQQMNHTSLGSPVTYNPNPLVVLNDLTLTNGASSPTFNSSLNNTTDQNVKVGGHFNIQTGCTYTPGDNETIFNGTGAQTFTNNGTITSGLYNFTVNKSAGTLTLAGSVTTTTVRNNLSITAGTLADGGNTIDVKGNVSNAGTHSGSGNITLSSSTAAQTITSTSGVFGNLVLNNTFNTTGSTMVTLTGSTSISGNLTMSQNNIFDISVYNLTLGGTSSILGTFGTTRFIKTSGLATDAGITKTYSASSLACTFPLGTTASPNYTPATITLGGTNPTAFGSITVRPVNSEHPLTTNTGVALTYYWKVSSSGFTLSGGTTVTHNYTYLTANVVATESDYVTGRYDLSSSSWTKGTTSDINTTTNVATFNATNFGAVIDGDYTVGDDNPSSSGPFNTIRVFYSRTGGAFDYNNTAGTSWSLTGHTGAATALVPTVNDVVVIGDATNNNHNMVIDANTAVCGQLKIAAGCTLTVGTFTGHNFGTYSTPSSGNGTIRVASNTTITGNFNDFIGTTGGTFEYYGSSFTVPTTFATYYNLVLTPDAGAIITMPDASITVYNNLTSQQGGSTGTSYFNTSATSRTVTINGSLNVLSGNLQIRNGAAQNIVVAGDVNISSGATFDVANSAALTHTLTISGSVANAGTLDLSTAGSDCNVTFSGSSNKTISGAGATTDFNVLTVNKGSSQTPVLEVISTAFTLSGATPNLVLTNGTFKFSTASSLTLALSTTSFTIPSTACLSMNSSGSIINIGTANAAANDLFLNGKLQVLAGTINVGTSGNTLGNDIEYSAAGFPELDIQGSGVLNVDGQIRRTLTSTTGSLLFSMSGTGSILIRGAGASSIRGMLEVTNTGSSFSMSGSPTIVFQNAAGVDYGDVYIVPTTATVSGGTLQFGNASTGASEIFKLISSVSLYNITINTTNSPTVQLENYALTLQNNLNIQAGGVFNCNSWDVSIGGNLTNSNVTSTTGTTVGGYRPGSSTQTTTFNSSTANQTITGTSTPNRTNFANLVINNTFGTVTLAANTAVTVNSALTLTAGTLADGGNTIRVLGNVSNSATHSGSGRIFLNGTTQQTLSGSGSGVFENIELSNSAGSIFTANQTVNGTLTITTGIFEINSYLLTLNTNANVSVTSPSATKMIKMSGSLIDQGITKNFPTGAFNITFAIGSGTKYTPASYNVTSNTAPGSINIVLVDNKHPSTQDPLSLELSYYWSVTATGFSGLNVTHTYNYIQSDVNGTETLYKTGRFYDGDWLPVDGYAGTVDATLNTMTLTNMNFIDGDYTAGESDGSTTIEFQALKTYYSRNATSGGNWDDPNSWSTDDVLQHAGAAATLMPSGNPVIIASGHTITANGNSRVARSTVINGTGILDYSDYIGHSPGTVSGTGTIRIQTTTGGSILVPAGNYSAFVASGGGTFEFYGTSNATLNSAAFTFNNVTFTGASTKTLASGSYVLNGNLTITTGTVSNTTNNSALSIKGNWTNNSGSNAFLPGSGVGTVTFNGTAAQSIGGSASTNFNNLVINNTSATGVTLNTPIFVTKALTLTDGFLFTTSTNLLTVNHNATASSGSASSYVAGPMKKIGNSSFVFPIGTSAGTKWARIGMTTVSGYNTTTEFTASYSFTGASNNTPASMNGGLDHVSYVEVWDLSRTLDPSNDATAKVSLYYEDASLNGSGILSPSDTRVAHYSSSSSMWENMGGSGASPITSTVNFTSFSPITFGSVVPGSANPLPVELIEFTAVPAENKKVLLNWKTASEQNNDEFIVERSENAVDFETVTVVASKAPNGNSNSILSYEATDFSPYFGISYYRLKQVDLNGTVEYSTIVPVNLEKESGFDFSIYPNPLDGNIFNVSIASELYSDYSLEFYDIQGKQLFSQKLSTNKSAVSTHQIVPPVEIGAGIYFVKLQAGGNTYCKKLIIR